jgi:hypothetical protein
VAAFFVGGQAVLLLEKQADLLKIRSLPGIRGR